jgi:glycosyltransferase involved in cell wall biosynthesis
MKVFRLVKLLLVNLIYFSSTGIFLIVLLFIKSKCKNNTDKPRLLWGPDPVPSNKYWSTALSEIGYQSKTLMYGFYHISKKEDFDYYYDDFPLRSNFFRRLFRKIPKLRSFFIFIFAVKNFDIFHIPAHGFVLRNTLLKKYEAQLLHWLKKKIVVLPYGSDFYRYSKVPDGSFRHALLKSYPIAGRNETEIATNYKYWVKHADCLINTLQIEGTGRWDILPLSYIGIDTKIWHCKTYFSENNGINGAVYVTHTPNHRGFKGTEFIIEAIEKLKKEGLQIEFTLIEGKSNIEVKEILQTNTDILVEQIIATGYALSGIEGMCCGLPVLSNLEDENFRKLFSRYSYLSECPIYSTTPETIVDNLRILITNPPLRRSLGLASRAFVEKYQSYKASQAMFEVVYNKIWFGKQDFELLDFYQNTNKSAYNHRYPKIEIPFKELIK